MQLTAKLIQILPLQSGTGKNGEWKKQDIIVETQDQYPKKICVSLWGNKFQHVSLNQGDLYTIDFDVESREYNGRWYTDVKAWRIEAQDNSMRANNSPANPSADEDIPPAENPFSGANEGVDDIPF